LRLLRHAVAEEEPREEGRPRDLLPEAVRILTLHGAKGLDFDHVYLMQLQKGGGGFESAVAADWVNGRLELRLAGLETLGFYQARERRRAVEACERVRLLYVGMTRAKARLVMSWLPQAFRRGGQNSLAQLMEAREPGLPDLNGLEERCAEAHVDRNFQGDALFVLPSRGAAAKAPQRDEPGPIAYDASGVEADARILAEERERAGERMDRPLAGRASDRPADTGAEVVGDVGRLRPEVARVVGTLVHAALESFDTTLDPDRALAGVESQLEALLRQVDPSMRDEVGEEAGRLLDGLRGGRLLARLSALDGAIVARELPLLLPASPDDSALEFVSGAIDLLYRDPADDRLVVVDYKSDRVEDLAQLAARAQAHAHQGAVYQRAVQGALNLPVPPRFEVWFLAHDREVALDPATPPGTPPEPLGLRFERS
jgi:ATP-dependent exoDNAse (exonuclease V) beta subunit